MEIKAGREEKKGCGFYTLILQQCVIVATHKVTVQDILFSSLCTIHVLLS